MNYQNPSKTAETKPKEVSARRFFLRDFENSETPFQIRIGFPQSTYEIKHERATAEEVTRNEQ